MTARKLGYLRESEFAATWYLDRFRDLNCLVEKRLREMHKGELATVGNNELLAMLRTNAHLYKRVFPDMIRSSMFVSIMSFLEVHMLDLCKQISERNGRIAGFKKPKKNKIKDARDYLFSKVKVRIPVYFNDKQDVDVLILLRNALVHDGGSIADEDRRTIKSWRGRRRPYGSIVFEVNRGSRIHGSRINLGSKAIEGVIKRMKGAIPELYDECRKALGGSQKP